LFWPARPVAVTKRRNITTVKRLVARRAVLGARGAGRW
jgi:hypothetical protein